MLIPQALTTPSSLSVRISRCQRGDQDPRIHASANLTFVWIDEEVPRPIFDEDTARLRESGRLGGWWMTYAPLGAEWWIKGQLYTPSLEGKLATVGGNALKPPGCRALRGGCLALKLGFERRRNRLLWT